MKDNEFEGTPVRKPGSPKYLEYGGWGVWESVEEQVKAAQRHNLSTRCKTSHEEKPAYYMECEHVDPDSMYKYAHIDDLVDEWLERNCNFDTEAMRKAPIKSPDFKLYMLNSNRARNNIPLYVEYDKKQREYDETHESDLCYLSPAGYYCVGCQEIFNDDFGVEIGACRVPENTKEEQDEFWYLFSEENLTSTR